jgi:prepilin-type N-terminal cleavage/methylation domain-containing protein
MKQSYPRSWSSGFTLIEVMIALVVLGIGIMGIMGMLHWAERGMAMSAKATQALALAEARLQSKQATSWEHLLGDDLNRDGYIDAWMHDDGAGDDVKASDGTYTASLDQDGMHLMWTVEMNGTGPITAIGRVWIEARARYEAIPGQAREIRLRALRANPMYVGSR